MPKILPKQYDTLTTGGLTLTGGDGGKSNSLPESAPTSDSCPVRSMMSI